MIKKLLFAVVLIIGAVAAFLFFKQTPSTQNPPIPNKVVAIKKQTSVKKPVVASNTQSTSAPLADINVQKLISVAASDGLQPKALKAALDSYAWAREHGKVGNKEVLTVVDFTLPSYDKRLWVLDLKTDTVLMNTYTTHGKGSGDAYATHFSNQGGSDASSLGLYVTADEYYGKHDKSMRIDGLEAGLNSNARARAVVIHSAYYATPEYIQSHHEAGRSWGCFAVDPGVKDQLLNDVKGGSVLFAYAPQEDHDPIVTNGPVAI